MLCQIAVEFLRTRLSTIKNEITPPSPETTDPTVSPLMMIILPRSIAISNYILCDKPMLICFAQIDVAEKLVKYVVFAIGSATESAVTRSATTVIDLVVIL